MLKVRETNLFKEAELESTTKEAADFLNIFLNCGHLSIEVLQIVIETLFFEVHQGLKEC